MIRSLLVVLVGLALGISGVEAATYFASPGGSGSACSSASPCSFQMGLDTIHAGDTLILRAGTYTHSRYPGCDLCWFIPGSANGNSGARTRIRVDAGATVILNGGMIFEDNAHHVTLDGLDGVLIIDGGENGSGNFSSGGLGGSNVSFMRFESFEMRWVNMGWQGAIHDSEWINVHIHHFGVTPSGFTSRGCWCGVDHSSQNLFCQDWHPSLKSDGECHGIYTQGSSARNLFERMEVHDGQGFAFHLTGSGDMTVRNNRLYRNGGPGIGFLNISNSRAYNNLLHENFAFAGGETQAIFVTGSGHIIDNNTVTQNTGQGIFVRDDASASAVRNNIAYNNSSTNIECAGSCGTYTNNLCNSGCQITGNPGFVAAAGGNFHIAAAGSPAVGSGTNLSGLFTTDLEGAQRPSSGAWDLGVYVFSTGQTPSFQFTAPPSVPSGNAPTLTWSAVASQGSGLSCQATVPSGGPDPNWTGTTSQQLIAGGSTTGTAMTAARTYRMRCTDSNGETTQDRVVAVVPACTRIVYGGGAPWAIPGTIEAEHFDSCSNLAAGVITGEGTTHHDLEATNQGGAYRLFEDVDIEQTPGLSNNHNVGYMQAGEWLEYRVNVGSTANYSLVVRAAYAGPNPGGTLQLSVDGAPAAATILVPSTGSWTTYSDLTPVVLPLTSGLHTLRLTVTANGGGALECCNVDRFVFASVGPPPIADFTGTPVIGVVPLAVTFTDASQGTITSRAWTFGDGGTSTATNPSHTYASVGSYTVSLTVTGPGGTNPLTRPNYVTVQALPSIGIVAKHPFEEGAGTTVADTSGNPTPHPCTLSSAGWSAGIVGAFGMDANGVRNCSFLSTPDTRPASPGLSVWVRCPPQANNAFAADMGGAWGLWFDNTGGRAHVYMNTSTGFVTLTSGPNVMNQANHMVTWSLDALGIRLWVDALEVGFTPTTGIPTYVGNERFTWASTAGDTEYLTGCTLDQGYLFDRPLNQALVNQLFNDTQSLLGVTQTHRRFYANATEGLPLAPLDTNVNSTLGQLVVLRDAIHYVGSPAITEYFPLWCQRNAGTLTKVTNSFGTLGLRVAQSTFANMGDLTTVPLPSPNGLPLDGFTPVAGRVVVDVIDPMQRTTLASGQHTEWAYFLESGAPAVAGDVFTCQPRRENDTDFTLPYAHLNTVTLQAAPPPGSVFIGGFTGGRLGP